MDENVNVDRPQYVNSDDPTLLLVKGNIDDPTERKRYVKQLASAIFVTVQKHKVARCRYVGAAAGNNAMKALIIARAEASKKGFNLAAVPTFQTVNFDNSGEKTSIVLEISDMVVKEDNREV